MSQQQVEVMANYGDESLVQSQQQKTTYRLGGESMHRNGAAFFEKDKARCDRERLTYKAADHSRYANAVRITLYRDVNDEENACQ